MAPPVHPSNDGGGATHAVLSTSSSQLQVCTCVCTHTPTPAAFSSHPAVVHALPSVSPHGELSPFGVHSPVAGTQPRLHSSTVQSVFTLCVCRQCPTPAASFSQPAVVHRLPSVSPHGVLASFATHVAG